MLIAATNGLSTLLAGFGVASLIVSGLSVLFLSSRTKTLGTLQDQTINALKTDGEQKDAEIARRDQQITSLQTQISNMRGQLTTLQDVVTQRENIQKLIELASVDATNCEKRHNEIMTALAQIGADRRN